MFTWLSGARTLVGGRRNFSGFMPATEPSPSRSLFCCLASSPARTRKTRCSRCSPVRTRRDKVLKINYTTRVPRATIPSRLTINLAESKQEKLSSLALIHLRLPLSALLRSIERKFLIKIFDSPPLLAPLINFFCCSLPNNSHTKVFRKLCSVAAPRAEDAWTKSSGALLWLELNLSAFELSHSAPSPKCLILLTSSLYVFCTTSNNFN